MIIDVHTNIWTTPDQLGGDLAQRLRSRRAERLSSCEASPGEHERVMTCVDASLVLGFRADRIGAHVPNELVAEFVRKDGRRRIGIAGVDPLSPDAMNQIAAGVDLGLHGVCISPACQGIHPAHSAAMRVYERCDSLGLPIFVTNLEPLTSAAVMDFARPSLLDEVARTFPNLPIVIGGFGYPWIDETVVLIGKHSNVFADIAGVASRPWQLYSALLNANAMGVMDKLLFGSGFPRETPAKAIEALYGINSYSHGTRLPSVPRAQIHNIVQRDSLRCLGIEADIAPRVREVVDEPVFGDRGPMTTGQSMARSWRDD
jgi:predicted TIM-barrel fold metal-dependent hydrolase